MVPAPNRSGACGDNLNLHISKKDTQDKKHTFCLHIAAMLGNINLQN
jgi:hypothetical protein